MQNKDLLNIDKDDIQNFQNKIRPFSADRGRQGQREEKVNTFLRFAII
jgi:hypothetical protein